MEVKPETVRNAENVVRDVKNWLAVFKTEYDIADEAMKILTEKIDEIGSKMAGIVCATEGVKEDSVKPVSDTVASARQWLAVFKTEYNLTDETVNILHKKFDEIAEKLALIECK